MEVVKSNDGKWVRASYGNYLTNSSATEDVDRVIVSSVFTPLTESNDEWTEISSEDAERIKKAKDAAKGSIDYPEELINQGLNLFSMVINTLDLTDDQALSVKNLYPDWSKFINKSLDVNFKVVYNDCLYKVKLTISVVLDQDGYRPGELGSEALYEEVNESNQGTIDDPIPYNNNMELFEGKYYSQDGVVYKCTRNTEQAVYHDLSALIGIYVEKVEE